MQKNNLPSDRWPTLYTAERSYWSDTQRSGSIIIPLVLVVLLSSLYLLFEAFVHINADPINQEMTPLELRMLLFGRVGSLFVPLVLMILVFVGVSRTARHFFEAFYKPPEGSASAKLINLRLFGRIPVPSFLSTFFHYPFVLIDIKDVTEGKFDITQKPVHWLGGPAILIVLDGAGLYLQRGNQFSRTLGPGIAFLDRYETVKDVIDLRHQTIRSGQPGMPPPVSGRTKDGIKIFFNVEAAFHIVRPTPQKHKGTSVQANPAKKTQAEKEAEELYLMKAAVDSGDLEAIRKAYESTAVRYTRINDERQYIEAKWRDGVWGTVSGELSKYITRHYLDELLVFEMPEDEVGLPMEETQTNEAKPPLSRAGQLLSWQEREKLRVSMDENLKKNRGVTLTDLRIFDVEIPAEVHEQRFQVLKAETDSRVKRIIGRATADQTRINAEKNAQAQRELIDQIAEDLKRIAPANFADSVLLSLSSILSQSSGDPLTTSYTAIDTLSALEQLREFLERIEK